MIISYLFFITFIGFLIQSISGFGSAVFALPLSALVVQRIDILPVFYILSIMQSITIAYKDRNYILKKQFLQMISFAIIGIVLGIFIGDTLNEKVLNYIIGIFIIINSLVNLHSTIKDKKSKKISNYGHQYKILPLFSGFLQATYGIGGPLIATYMNSVTEVKKSYRVMISFYWCILNPIIILELFSIGEIKTSHLGTLLALIPAMLLGIYVGNKVVDKISRRNFQILIHCILILIGITLFL